ncbi:sensor domain-containing protein [Aureimonas populi]|uniref:EAL domain-containing protein n=1 Tax=Aureimonas populi TaxID=1701758 RepID=A0ABW5CRI7_9HYPH|nr:GGDEF domain-containing phosphodiesterase [Aureimonas populi]
MSIPLPFSSDAEERPSSGAILNAIGHPVLALDSAGRVVFANGAARQELGERIVGQPLDAIFAEGAFEQIMRSGAGPLALVSARGGRYEARVGMAVAAGAVLSLTSSVGCGAATQAETDELTGLATRGGLHEELSRALLSSRGEGQGVAVHCLDLDRFKIINDTLGHEIGDRLIAKVASRLRAACRKGDCIARIGGDEFVVVQTGAGSAADAERLAKRLVDLVGRTYVLGGHTVNIAASVGVAVQEEGLSARDLMRDAELALHEAKRGGRGQFRLFETGMDASIRERRELEVDLRRALALRQFELHYQPFLELSGNKVTGFEALLRWDHPTRGRISPLSFIPLAEETGLIGKIGEWVLRTACTTAAGWPDPMTVAVNVSPVQFKDGTLVETVLSALAQSGLPAHRLEIEITESALLDETQSVLAALARLRDMGVRISMDDFGTGYSSLSYLQKFPFDKIKIDRSFIQGASENPESAAILKAIARLGSSLGMAITAEGVETAEQLERIRGEHCTHVQGYFTGRPMASASIGAFLDR